MSDPKSHSSVLIVGAGIFGASTAYHLITSDPSLNITVLDRTPYPPEPAASTDINKIIRADYSSPFYAALAYEAIDAWQSWPELRDFYHRTGWIMIGEEDSDDAERIRKVFRERGHDPTSDVPLAELGSSERWNGILKGTNTDGFKDAYWNPEAGWCEASHATAAIMEAAIKKGVKYLCGDVQELVLGDGQVAGVKTTNQQVYTADKIVLATGAWTSALMTTTEDKLSIPDADRTEQQASAAAVCVAHYKLSTAEMQELALMPVVVYGANGEVIPPPKENNLLKFTNARSLTNTIVTASGHTISVPPLNTNQRLVSENLKQETHDSMMTRVMPNFTRGKIVDYWRLCWDAFTPSQDWLMTRHSHSNLQNLYFAIGGSFHSYKFLPTAGKYMVNVLSGKGNGAEMDKAWGWKRGSVGRGAHENTAPRRELRDLDD